jgi:hypothetical protein
MRTTAAITTALSRERTGSNVLVSVRVSKSGTFRMLSRLSGYKCTVVDANGNVCDLKSVEGACLSGVRYATRLVDKRHVLVEILDARGRLASGDSDGLDRAAAVAVLKGLELWEGLTSSMIDEILADWRIHPDQVDLSDDKRSHHP